jgi:hypothetical protein
MLNKHIGKFVIYVKGDEVRFRKVFPNDREKVETSFKNLGWTFHSETTDQEEVYNRMTQIRLEQKRNNAA